jgi:hypothetical protein
MSTISRVLALPDSTMCVSNDPPIRSLVCTLIDTLLNGIRNWLCGTIPNALLVVMSSADGVLSFRRLLYILLSLWLPVGVAFVHSFLSTLLFFLSLSPLVLSSLFLLFYLSLSFINFLPQ